MKIAILGAECTGKTTLAKALVQSLNEKHGATSLVAEVLREWCAKHGRTPCPEEQRAIAEKQAQRVHAAAPGMYLIADTTALMTAVYSDVLFKDLTLYPFALEQQRSYDLTLLTGLDLPWVADGIQRDGPQSQMLVDTRLRQVLHAHSIAYTVVYGVGAARTQCALKAILNAYQTPPERFVPVW